MERQTFASSPKNERVLHSYRILVGGMVLFGSVATLDMVWSLADITMALMAICNLIAILFLGKYAVRLLSDYRAQKKAGIQSPVFKKETMPESKRTGMLVKPTVFTTFAAI